MKTLDMALCIAPALMTPAAARTTDGTVKEDSRPNIVFILTDDQNFQTVHSLGNRYIETPNMDRIVKAGTAFTQAHVMGGLNGAVSQPSRAMLLTGRGLMDVHCNGSIIPPEEKTFPEMFREAGYTTFGTGKWHADKKSFNRSFEKGDHIFFGGMHQYNQNGHMSPRLHHYDPTAEYKEPFVGDKFSSEMYADAAVKFLSERKKNDRPFFAFVAFTSPHDPRNQHPGYGHTHHPEEMELPVNYLPQHPFDNGELKIRDEVLLPFPRTEEMIRKDLADYYGMISEVDVQIGRIIQTLREKGELENTILIFASDNGLAVGRHGLLGKQNLYEHSISVPLVMVVPGMKKGVRSESLCYLYDITTCFIVFYYSSNEF